MLTDLPVRVVRGKEGQEDGMLTDLPVRVVRGKEGEEDGMLTDLPVRVVRRELLQVKLKSLSQFITRMLEDVDDLKNTAIETYPTVTHASYLVPPRNGE